MYNADELDSLNRPLDSTALYFPSYEFETTWDNDAVKSLDSGMAMISSSYLFAIKEPILSCKYLGKRMYRLFYVGESEPKSIRLIKEENRVDVIIKYAVYEGSFIFSPILLAKEINFSIKPEYWDTLSTLAKKARMWNVPPTTNDANTYFGFFIEGHSEYGYTHLGRARVSEGINAKETRELRNFFNRVEKLK